MEKIKKIIRLFWVFFRFGCFTFGGGWAIVAQMKEMYVNREQALTDEELLDITSVGRSLPGMMIGNIAMLYGHREAGLVGGLACLIGMSIPPVCILVVVTHFYSLLQNNLWVASAMAGIRSAVVPIVASAAIGMIKSAFTLPPCIAVAAITFALYMIFNLSCVWLVVIGIVCGILISEYYEHRGAGMR